MKVEHLIRRDFLTVDPYLGINAIKKQLLEHSAIVVQDDDQFYGILTINDIAHNPRTLIVDCLTIKTLVDYEYSVEQVLSLMNSTKTDILPVGRSDKFIGLVFKSDLYKYITEYNLELEEKIKERTLELEKSIEVKDLLFSIIAHDLKNTINSLLGFSELLRKNIRNYPIEKTEERIKILNTNARNAHDLLDNLLKWAKTQIGQLGFNPEFLNISILCKEVVENLNETAQMKSITLNFFHSSDVYAFADKNMVETILRNLLSNAIKFTNTNGKVDVFSIINDSFVEVVVSDNGVGLCENEKDNLFKLDYNRSHVGKANEKGSGLGLVICKDFVEMNGGELWIENKPEKGCEVRFTLPKYQGQ